MNTLVVGKGISGIDTAQLLISKGVTPVYFDISEPSGSYELYSRFSDPEEVLIYYGTLPGNVLEHIDDVIVADAIPMDDSVVRQLSVMGFPIRGELEVAASYDRGKILAVTGTKGKTSATTLLGKIVKDRTRNEFTVGDDIASYADLVCSTTKDSTTVVKVTSRNLETIKSFHPHVSSIINIMPSYVSRYESPGEYINVKERIMANQTRDDHIILNYDEEYTRRIGLRLDEEGDGVRPFFFSTQRELKRGLFLKGDAIILRDSWGERKLLNASDLSIVGKHNLENAFTAMAMAYKYGIPTDSIIRSCMEFSPVAHRVEYVATKNGVMFYNDSKGTDVDTAINGIEAMDRPTYLIGGGNDNGGDYGEWIDSFGGKVRKLVLIGQTRERMASVAKAHGFYDYVYAEDLEEAVRICTSHANPGEAILLSPACETGAYRNFKERGDAFRAIVEKL